MSIFALAHFAMMLSPMPEGGAMLSPKGYVALCRETQSFCAADRAPPTPPRAIHAGDLRALERLNIAVNRRIAARPDRGDQWSVDPPSGDCEDYALTKRAALLARGWTASQALVAISRLEDGAPHAVLILRTTTGDLVMDNLSNEIIDWRETRMRFIARQSATTPALWVKIVDTEEARRSVENLVRAGAP